MMFLMVPIVMLMLKGRRSSPLRFALFSHVLHSVNAETQNDPEATKKFQEVGEAYMCLTQEDYDSDDDDDYEDDDSDDYRRGHRAGGRGGFGRSGMSAVRTISMVFSVCSVSSSALWVVLRSEGVWFHEKKG